MPTPRVRRLGKLTLAGSASVLLVLSGATALAAPAVTSVAPSVGNLAGSTPVTIKGTGFKRGATVKIGNVACTQVKVLPDSVILCVNGAHAEGAVSVTVFNTASDSNATNSLFSYNNNLDLTKTTKSDFEGSGSSRTNLVTTGLDTTLRWVDWSPATGGSMAAGTYYYVLTVTNAAGETKRSVQSAGTALSGGNNAVNLAWTAVNGALSYKLYRTTTSGSYSSPSLIATLDTTGYKDTAASPASGAPPGSGTATGDLFLAYGTTPATTFSAGPATTGTVGLDAFSILRPNGTFLIVHGNGSNTTSIYDPVGGTMSVGPTLTGNSQDGGHAFKRPDGKFLIVHANAGTGTTIYDPVGNTMSAGPATTANVGSGALSVQRPDGNFLIVHGNSSNTTSVYDPVASTMSAGPTLCDTAALGAFALQRPDGKFLIVRGNGQTATCLYDPGAGTMSAGPATTDQVSRGGHCLQRPDGDFLIVCGNKTTATSIYNPVANTMAAGPALSEVAREGAHSIQRADGTFLIFSGKVLTNTTVYDPVASSMAAGPATLNAVGSGGHSLQRPDGKYLLVNGSLGTSTNVYDAGWHRTGSYVSENLNPSGIVSWNTIAWVRDLDDTVTVKVRTATSSGGLSSATWRTATNGGSIGAGAGETWLQIGADYARAIPRFTGALDDIWDDQCAYWRTWPLPDVLSFTANYTPTYSVATSKASFAFGTQLLNTWMPADSSILTNNGTLTETLVAKISTFTAGANTWSLSASSNGADQVRAQWSTTTAAGPWTDIAAYSTDFTVKTGLAASGTVKLYFRIQTPTSTSSFNQYASSLTVTAQ